VDNNQVVIDKVDMVEVVHIAVLAVGSAVVLAQLVQVHTVEQSAELQLVK
jgi:hypothetical protein